MTIQTKTRQGAQTVELKPGPLWLKAQNRRMAPLIVPATSFGLARLIAAAGQAGCIAFILASALTARPVPKSAYGVFFGLMLVQLACLLGSERFSFRAGATARRRIRNDVIDAILQAGPALLRKHHSATLAQTLVDHVEAVDGLFRLWKPASILALLGPGLIGIVVFVLNWRDGLILLGCGLLVPAGMALAGIGAAAATKRQFQALIRLQTRFVDRLRGIATIVLNNRAEDEAQSLRQAADELRQRTMRVLRVAFLSSAALDCAAALALVSIAMRSAPALHGKNFGPMMRAIAELLLVAEFFAPLRSFAAAYQERMHANEAAAILGELPRPKPPSGPVALFSAPPQGVNVSFQDVRLTWDPERPPVLDGMTFDIVAGETVLLIGASGSGKSTIMETLLGFTRPDSGKATLNGLDVTRLPAHDLTGLISWIGQRPVLFAGTIRDNIMMARPDATVQELNVAVRSAKIDQFLGSLPRGLDTIIGEGGYGLSGGQAQRVAIARAFLKDAPLLLLDEPTSYLDMAIEQDVLESLRRLAMGRTVIVATHSDAANLLQGRAIYIGEGRVWTGEADS